jgi:hypothetical protein
MPRTDRHPAQIRSPVDGQLASKRASLGTIDQASPPPSTSSTQDKMRGETTMDNEAETDSAAKRRSVRLPPGGYLATDDSALAVERKARVVVLAGFQGSGKTTLLCCLYGRYQQGPFAGTSFAGSRSLRAFEQIAHEDRPQSGREVPTTQRTSRSQTGFLHLRMMPDNAESSIDVLFSDLSGEPYAEIVDRPSLASTLPALQRGDSIGIVVDGSLLVGPEERHVSAYRTQLLQRAILDYGGSRADADLDIILTKWDVLQAAGHQATEYALALVRELADAASESHDAASFVTCGRSLADKKVTTGSGLDALVKRWSRPKKPPIFGPVQEAEKALDAAETIETEAVG